jgi:Transposase IS116/IS110/IS902 family
LIYRSQPGLGLILGARVLAEFGDDPDRYPDAKARNNYSGMSPITKASGTKRVVLARFARNRRLGDALLLQAFAALNNSPGARAFSGRQRAPRCHPLPNPPSPREPALGILHGCRRTHTLYDEHLAWHTQTRQIQFRSLAASGRGMSSQQRAVASRRFVSI